MDMFKNKKHIKEHKNIHGSWRYIEIIEVLRSKTIGMCKKLTLFTT